MLLARFVPPVRAFVPIVAGALGMAPWKFYSVNAAAIVAWAMAHTLPGMLAVSALHRYAGFSHRAHVGKHLWIFVAVAGAAVAAMAIAIARRRGRADKVEPLG